MSTRARSNGEPRFRAGDSWRTDDDNESDSGTEHGQSDPSYSRLANREDDEQAQLESVSIIPYWSAKRHLTCGNPTPPPPWSSKPIPWRGTSPGKLKTHNAVLVLCLNINVDPPDVVKTNPCAVLEAWVDPHSMPTHKALEAIGTNLQNQFEGLSPKIPFKTLLDPSYEDLRRYCTGLRKTAKDDATLFYYNGHGVPKPTASGELWCFNRNYTKYIPVSLQEVQGWLGSPGVYVWDCSGAGHLLTNFNLFAQRRDREMSGTYTDDKQSFLNSLQFAACAANEQLPSCPELPADLFTSCLTSPIDIALRYFVMNHQLPNNITADMVMQLPGDLKDRRTPLGELNWIFTAITDTIAWTTFPREVFTRLYRSDLLIAPLFRNFLLAERIMKDYNCTPHTSPPLPAANTHPMWAAWDHAIDTCLRQLPDLVHQFPDMKGASLVPTPSSSASPSNSATVVNNTAARAGRIGQQSTKTQTPVKGNGKPYVYVPSRFFADQLTAFEVWISRGGSALTRKGPMSLPIPSGVDLYEDRSGFVGIEDNEVHLVPRKPPDQLPIVLQVLLSQPHRLRALILLSQFVDLGPWAVHLVLSIGIFPYISRLLLALGQDLRPVLIFIWARILAVDPSVQLDLYNTGGYKYFYSVLAAPEDNSTVIPNVSEHKAMCAFILSVVCRDFPHGQSACGESLFDQCYSRLEADDFLLRQWTALCIGQLWDGHDDLRVHGVDRAAQDTLIGMLADNAVEVRCAALFALGTFLGASGSADPSKQGGGGTGNMHQLEDERVHFRMEIAVATGATLAIMDDASPMARKELLVVISALVKEWRGYFVVCAWLYSEEDRQWRGGPNAHHQPHNANNHTYSHEDPVTAQALAEWLDGFGDDELVREENRVLLSSFFTIYVVLLDLSVDPYPEVATNAQTIVDYIMALLLDSPFTRLESSTLGIPPTVPHEHPRVTSSPMLGGEVRSRVPSSSTLSMPASPASPRPSFARNDSMTSTLSTGVTNTLRRTGSIANAIRGLAGGIAFPSTEVAEPRSPLPLPQPRAPVEAVATRPPSPNLNIARYDPPYSPASSRSASSSSRRHATQHPSPPASPASTASFDVAPMDFLPSDVMEALMEEDMERLRARRRTTSRSRRHPVSPSNSTFSVDSNSSSIILGLGTGAGVRDVLPLKSTFYDWCAEYFTEPQMRQSEPDEPGSIQYNYQVWRQHRNEQIIRETHSHAEAATGLRWDRPVASVQVSGHPLSMAFHAYDKHLVVANETDVVTVWDWSRKQRLNRFCNGNAKGTSITALHIINQDVGGLILTGAADGIIRLYRNYDALWDKPVQMVSSFRGLGEMIQLRQGSGLVVDWKQTGGMLTIGGDSRIIRVWDAHTEEQVSDIETNSESPVTSIISDPSSSSLFAAGFADGVVKIFDRRDEVVVRTYSGHTAWVQNLRWHPTMASNLLSASMDGEVKLWDVRHRSFASARDWNVHPHGLAAFDVHPVTSVFAATSALNPTHWRSQRTVVQSLSPDAHSPLSEFSVTTGLHAYPPRPLPSPFIPRSTSLVFHPTEMLYGLGLPDGTIRIVGCKLS